jgi:hypothetical protein
LASGRLRAVTKFRWAFDGSIFLKILTQGGIEFDRRSS